MKQILFAFVFFSYTAVAQSTDFLLLQKHEHTIATFYTGSHISLITNTDAFIDADITAIKSDSIFLQQAVVEQIPTTLGVYMLDTVRSYRYAYRLSDIKAVVTTLRRGFDFSASGASLFGGGAILVVASGIVYLADRSNFSPVLFFGGAAVATIGYFISKVGGKTKKIGNKFKLVYVDASTIQR